MPTEKKVTITTTTLDNLTELNLEEFCLACEVTPDFIIELVEYGTLDPAGETHETWRFNEDQMKTTRTALRLHEDLGVNHAGIALAIDLMNELDELRKQIEVLEKFFQSER